MKGEKLSDWEVGFLLIEAIRRSMEVRIDALEKKIESLDADVRSLRSSMDSLRDTVIAKLLEKVKV